MYLRTNVPQLFTYVLVLLCELDTNRVQLAGILVNDLECPVSQHVEQHFTLPVSALLSDLDPVKPHVVDVWLHPSPFEHSCSRDLQICRQLLRSHPFSIPGQRFLWSHAFTCALWMLASCSEIFSSTATPAVSVGGSTPSTFSSFADPWWFLELFGHRTVCFSDFCAATFLSSCANHLSKQRWYFALLSRPVVD